MDAWPAIERCMLAQWRGYGPQMQATITRQPHDQQARVAQAFGPTLTHAQAIWRVERLGLPRHQGALIVVKDLVIPGKGRARR